MDAMLVRSPLASYSFTSSKGTNLHVCYQDKSGNIKQSIFDSKSGWRTSPNGIISKADLNNELAITGWASGDEEHVYYIGEGNKIVERCWSATKQLTNSIPFSPLAATPVAGSTPSVRVYLQDTSSQIMEWGIDDGKNYKQYQKGLPTN